VSARCVVTARCHVEVRSIPGGINTCEEAYVKLNGIRIFYLASHCNSTIDSTPGAKIGFHIHLIDPFTCSIIEEPEHFETHGNETHAHALRDYLDGLDDYAVITGNMIDEAFSHLSPAYDALLRLGIDLRGLKYRGPFAFVTQKSTNKTVQKVRTQKESKKSPAKLSVMITGM